MDNCIFCGRPIMTGAMRCPACGKMQKTAAEQMSSIERYKEDQKKKGRWALVKLALIIAATAVAVAYFFYPEDVMEAVDKLVGMVKGVEGWWAEPAHPPYLEGSTNTL